MEIACQTRDQQNTTRYKYMYIVDVRTETDTLDIVYSTNTSASNYLHQIQFDKIESPAVQLLIIYWSYHEDKTDSSYLWQKVLLPLVPTSRDGLSTWLPLPSIVLMVKHLSHLGNTFTWK